MTLKLIHDMVSRQRRTLKNHELRVFLPALQVYLKNFLSFLTLISKASWWYIPAGCGNRSFPFTERKQYASPFIICNREIHKRLKMEG